METNILKALKNISTVKSFSLPSHYGTANRMNNMGVALEYFVRDAFCGTFNLDSLAEKEKEYANYLSYIGNSNNPPDFIVRGGDAVEVKKIINARSGLALNSSYPKNKLHADNPLITDACRQCEEWQTKDIIYTVGVVADEQIDSLWFVYGDCYAADKSVYEKTRAKVIESVTEAPGIDFSDTNELGRVNRVDPLGITYLRIRGMWGIDNPSKVFEYLNVGNKMPRVVALMRTEKYNSFSQDDKDALVSAEILDVEIKNPDNPAQFIGAKLIKI